MDFRLVKRKKGEESKGYTGRTTIDNPNRTTSFSKRALKGSLLVEKTDKFCENCGHNKILISTGLGIIKCSKCKTKRKK